jgi:hypothetical protein
MRQTHITTRQQPPTGAASQRSQQPQLRPVDPKTGRPYRVVRSARPFHPPAQALRTATLDNLALLPASLLPFKAAYQAIANQQTPGTVLVVLPIGDSLPRRTLEQVVTHLRAKGQPVQIVLGTQLGEDPR